MSLPPINSIIPVGSIDAVALFRPLRMVVTNVTNAAQAVVTTAIANQYSLGQHIRLLVPAVYGMTLDQVVQIVGLPGPSTLVVDLNTLGLDPFVIPATSSTPAQCIPVDGADFNTYDSPPVVPTIFISSLT